MSLHHNGRGRTYALCDEPSCEQNVIDLPLDLDAANRILRTFFLWKNIGNRQHHCASCAKAQHSRA